MLEGFGADRAYKASRAYRVYRALVRVREQDLGCILYYNSTFTSAEYEHQSLKIQTTTSVFKVGPMCRFSTVAWKVVSKNPLP